MPVSDPLLGTFLFPFPLGRGAGLGLLAVNAGSRLFDKICPVVDAGAGSGVIFPKSVLDRLSRFLPFPIGLGVGLGSVCDSGPGIENGARSGVFPGVNAVSNV